MFKSVFFELGREVVTPGIYGAMESSREFASEIMHAMRLFCLGNWVECQRETKR